MSRPVGRPPEQLLAQVRAFICNPATTAAELAFFDGAVHAMKQERSGAPQPRKRAPQDGSGVPGKPHTQVDVELIEGQQ